MLRTDRLARALALAAVAAGWLLATTGTAQAQWMWRDAQGQVTASDRPPPKEIADKDILARPAPGGRRVPGATPAPTPAATQAASAAASAPTPPASPLEAAVEARRRAAEQQATAKARADDERVAGQRAENCRRARVHAAALESGQRMARNNERGEREVLDDKGRAEELRQAREVIASDCR